MPLTSLTNTQHFAGSWFPTGYYGHFRAKSRVDLCDHFRQLARPNPPKKFLDRQNSEATTHKFSHHDNRCKVEGDPLVRGTQGGFGKRKGEANVRGEFDPFFISWIPKSADRKKYIDDIKTTSYATDYNGELTSSQILSEIQSTNSSTLPSIEPSVYSTTYNHGQPNHQQSKQIRQETLQRYLSARTRRSKLQSNERSPSVASCLVWNRTNDTMTNTIPPITVQPRINSHVTSTNNQEKPLQSCSMPTFKIVEQPRCGTTTSQEHYNFKGIPTIRTATSFEQPCMNSVESLMSKYM